MQCADDSVVVLDNVDVRPRLVVALADDEMSRCNMLSASECVAGVFMLACYPAIAVLSTKIVGCWLLAVGVWAACIVEGSISLLFIQFPRTS